MNDYFANKAAIHDPHASFMKTTSETPTTTAEQETFHGKDHDLEAKVVAALKTCYDPEIPVNIYELGLIYQITLSEKNEVNILMTLTSPMCPVAESLPGEVEQKVRSVEGVLSAKVELTWDPPWSAEKMSEAAKLQLNLP